MVADGKARPLRTPPNYSPLNSPSRAHTFSFSCRGCSSGVASPFQAACLPCSWVMALRGWLSTCIEQPAYVCVYIWMYVCIYIYTCAYYSGLSYKAHRGVTSLFSVTQEALLETPAKESTARGFVVILINLACNGSKSELCHAHSPSEAIRASL